MPAILQRTKEEFEQDTRRSLDYLCQKKLKRNRIRDRYVTGFLIAAILLIAILVRLGYILN